MLNLLAFSFQDQESGSIVRLDSNGYGAMHVASACGRLKMVALLLQHGADSNTLSGQGLRPLDYVMVCLRGDFA